MNAKELLAVARELDEVAIDELRHMVSNFNACNESFNQRFTLEQLVTLHRVWMACGWDIYPDTWTDRQIREALRGIPPQWDDNEEPVYQKREKR